MLQLPSSTVNIVAAVDQEAGLIVQIITEIAVEVWDLKIDTVGKIIVIIDVQAETGMQETISSINKESHLRPIQNVSIRFQLATIHELNYGHYLVSLSLTLQ